MNPVETNETVAQILARVQDMQSSPSNSFSRPYLRSVELACCKVLAFIEQERIAHEFGQDATR
jgi:hypothetical protein